ncbi:MAG: PAS domain S-box protein, partial [Bacteroidales bacterium]|nr:PAS domain S-box protein [Bacteroidales bacterium]
MKQHKMPYRSIAVYVILLIVTSIMAGWLISNRMWVWLIVVAVAMATVVVRLLAIYTNIAKQVDFIFEAVQNNDNSFHFSEDPNKVKNVFLNYSLNRIKEVLDNQKEQIRQREKNFELIMECSNVGIIIVQSNGSVLQANSKAATLFGMERISHINRLNFLSNDLVEVLHLIQPGEQKTVRYQTETDEMNLMLTCAAMTI